MEGWEFLALVMDRNREVERLHIIADVSFLVRGLGRFDVGGKGGNVDLRRFYI
jgi:hypothetical protein